MKLNTLIVTLSFFLLFSLKLSASHFMGSAIWYECLPDGCSYRVFQTTYLDCAGAATQGYLPPGQFSPNPFPAPFLALNANGCSPTFQNNPVLVSYDEVTPVIPSTATQCTTPGTGITGVVGATYYQDINLCSLGCNSVTISWGSCCRNYAITSGASGDAIYNSVTINPPLSTCNNSPIYNHLPITYLCAGQIQSFSQSATDIDGDSLSYTLGSCYKDSVIQVNYNTGYSPTSPLGPDWLVNLDPITGEITFTPNPTGSIVSGVLCIYITEWRNGVQIGQIWRDLMVSVLNCGTQTSVNTPPKDTLLNLSGGMLVNPVRIEVYSGQQVTFEVQYTDPDPGQILGFHQNALPINAYIIPSYNGGVLNLYFSWLTTPADTGSHYLWLDGFDDATPFNAHIIRYIDIHVNPMAIMGITTPTPCGGVNIGTIDLSVLTGSPPYTYLWSNGDTTEDLTGLASGAYSVTVTDSIGDSWSSTYYVNSLNGFLLNPSLANFTCGQSTGIIALNVTGGTPPYHYDWNTGDTTATVVNLPTGGYSVNITDANNCFLHEVILATAPCFSKVGGILYVDSNGNCVKDTNEQVISSGLVHIDPGGYRISDSLGYYEFLTGVNTFTLTYLPLIPAFMTTPCPGINPFSVNIPQLGIDSTDFDIPVTIDSVIELRVQLTERNYVPGWAYHSTFIYYKNSSFNPSAPAQLVYHHDSLLTNLSFSVQPTTYNLATHTAIWDFPAGISFSSNYHIISIYSPVDSSAVLGDTAFSFVEIFPINGDMDPTNNKDSVVKVVVASYDPNYKEVSPSGITQNGYIPFNTPVLDYTVHFQNTGTWAAEYVIIKDKIDPNLDLNTLEYLGSSHYCTIAVDANDTLIITFAHINLPDSGTDMAGSQGFVSFSIKPKTGLIPETKVQNTAGIYFDFNAPVITNTINSTFHNPATILLSDPKCEGGTITATVQNGVPPYLWNGSIPDLTGSYSFSPNASGIQTIYLQDAFAPVNLSYNVIAPPSNAGFTFLNSGNTTLFFPQNNSYSTYHWDFGNGTTSNFVTPAVNYSQSGNYTVTLMVSNDCGNFTDSMTISVTTDIPGYFFAKTVKIYPNPFSHTTKLTFENADNSAYVLILIDVTGRIIRTYNTNGNEILIYSEGLPSGIYTWELKGKENAKGKIAIKAD